MAAGSRDRVTVDLRGAGPVVQAKATAQGLTLAAFVRRALMTITASWSVDFASAAMASRRSEAARGGGCPSSSPAT